MQPRRLHEALGTGPVCPVVVTGVCFYPSVCCFSRVCAGKPDNRTPLAFLAGVQADGFVHVKEAAGLTF